MTTPAGWYDDGSGRQRWWDGNQWTEHFAPVAEAPRVTEPATSEPAESGQAEPEQTESGSAESEQTEPGTPEPEQTESGAAESGAAEPEHSEEASVSEVSESFTSPDNAVAETPIWPAPESATPVSDPSPPMTQPHDNLVHPAPGAPYLNSAASNSSPQPPYSSPQPPYSSPQPPGSGYAATNGYPTAGYAVPQPEDQAPQSKVSVLGLIGLGLAAIGTVVACFPLLLVPGLGLTAVGFVVSLVSLFLKGKKWPGIVGLIVSVIGSIIAVVLAVAFFAGAILSGDRPDLTPPTQASDAPDDDGVASGTQGSSVTVEQLSGTATVTIDSAEWSNTGSSSLPPSNGGFLTVDLTWKGTEGTSRINPFYFTIETEDGTEGEYDLFAEKQIQDGEVEAGDSVTGTIVFDVAESPSYTVVITDEALQEVARITVTPEEQ